MPTGPQPERGTYQRELISATAQTWAAGTEVEVAIVATKLLASGTDEKILWARCHGVLYDSAAQNTVTEWMLIKCLITDATQDLNDAATVELLLKRGNLLKRGWIYSGSGAAGGKIGGWKWEIFNVNLNDGEEIRMLFRPAVVSAANTCAYIGELEYRIAGE